MLNKFKKLMRDLFYRGPANCVVMVELSVKQGNSLIINIASLDNQFVSKKHQVCLFDSDNELKTLLGMLITQNHVYHENMSIQTIYRCLDTKIFNLCVEFMNSLTSVSQENVFNTYHKEYKWRDYGMKSNNTVIINRAGL